MADYMQGDKDTGTTVPFSDNETEVKDVAEVLVEDDNPAASPQERLTKKQKRQERLQKLLQEGNQNKEELGKTKSELSELKSQLSRLEGFIAAQQAQQAQQRQQGADPYKARLDAIEARRKDAWKAAQAEVKAGTMDESRTAYYESVSREIEEEKSQVMVERELARREPVQQQNNARQRWVNQYPEVYANQNAFQWAAARSQMRVAEGEQLTDAVAHEILQEARVRFKLGGKAPPSASEKDRFSGVSSSGSSASNDNAGIRMTPEYKRMATALYDHLPEAEAIKKWVNGPGKNLRAKKVI